MDKHNRQYILNQITVHVVRTLQLEKDTEHLRVFTPEHTEAWVKGVEEVIEDLQDAVANVKRKYNVS